MKKLFLILLILFSVSNAFSQDRKLNFSIGFGMNFPNSPGDFKNYWNTGFNISGDIYYNLNDNFQSGLQMGLYKFGIDRDRIINDARSILYVKGGEKRIITLMPGNRFTFKIKQISPYLELGIGLFHLHIKEWQWYGPPEDKIYDINEYRYNEKRLNETRFGFRLGSGIEIKKYSILSVQLDINYLAGFTDDRTSQFLTSGLRVKF
ncbi:outer membrane beta-barrel protein [candidate division KSB1 bacterium]